MKDHSLLELVINASLPVQLVMLLLLGASVFIFYHAVERFFHPEAVNGLIVIILAGVGVGFIFYLWQFNFGLGITGRSRDVSWGFYIANFTFLVGVAAAAVPHREFDAGEDLVVFEGGGPGAEEELRCVDRPGGGG